MVGKIAEDFTLKDQYGNEFNLCLNLRKKILLIFYPKDNTPVCTRQLLDYQINKSEFLKRGIILVAVNADSEESHLSFVKKCSLDLPILSDPNKEICKKFNAVNLFGGIKRKLVLVDEFGKILFEDETLSFSYKTSSKLIKLLENL